jgi:uncharacterized membrane protein YgcG
MTVYYRLALVLLLTLAHVATVAAQEEILNFHSDIQVQLDGSMLVTETIQVQAEGNKIKRGIYRDFPTIYKDRFNNRYRVKFDLQMVQRDGRSEPYHTESLDNGIRIYIGDKDVYLDNGIYTYTLTYTTDRQLGFFDTHDELYWNVTGNGWNFPMQRASARVTLPPGVPPEQIGTEAYTGLLGSKDGAYDVQIDPDGGTVFNTTEPLSNYEGLTIVVTWPKGHIKEPGWKQQLKLFLEDNLAALVGTGGSLLLLLYYFLVWRAVGRDPEAGIVVPLYSPPKNYSPASMRFIRRMGYDDKAFGTAIVNLAVKGYLTISESSSGTFTLEKTGDQGVTLAAGEEALAAALFEKKKTKITLKQKSHSRIRKALRKHERSLKRDYEKRYFRTNSGFLLPGILVSIITVVACFLALPKGVGDVFALWLITWTIGITLLTYSIYKLWKGIGDRGSFSSTIAVGFFAVPFGVADVHEIKWLIFGISLIYPFTLAMVLLLNFLFYDWLKAPTLAGRRLLDKIDGFRLFLSVAEGEELNFRNPPEKTPELFEEYLPYALALDVEQQWGERFTEVLKQAGTEEYQPTWYHGHSWSHNNITGFTSAVGGALSSAISSSSTAPGSSSGSSGGGFSGGGGGGGGGGGW